MSNEAEFERELDQQLSDLDRQNRNARRRNILLVVAVVVALLLAALCAFLALDNNRLAESNAQYGAQQAQEKQTIAKEAQKALCGTKDREIYDATLCEKWAEVAQEPPPATPTVASGPSQEELVKAFREYCSDGNCKGRDGATPTADDIAAAFVKFCAGGRCTGPSGKDAAPAKDGKDGTNGKDGQPLPPSGEMVLAAVTTYCSTSGACVGTPGKNGPPPTAEAVLAAVQQVCANDACRGPMGPAGTAGATGAKGDKGEDGRGIESAYCGDDGRWLITYTDTTTSDGGQCRPVIIPGPGATP
ncbi:minor tail protein [Arthrobacter phage Popper]|uniref:Minor tail protein n=1 Tax=Arthrobacter phage Popper TaxID=2859633 RepID=A0AAE8BH90_9CAUD|nr:minor tail protein [Arthrobacter phage Popper]QYC54941.1 minor tail protein [Arthrobacter phage Popper]